MRTAAKILILSMLSTLHIVGQSLNPEQAATIEAAEKAAMAALTFRQGDVAGFGHARSDFTPDGWVDFLKRMQGFLDVNGAPTFTSSFAASGPASVLDEHDGIIHFRVPGTLIQSNALGRTTYRAAIDVHAGGSPVRIERLEQITCLRASTACQ